MARGRRVYVGYARTSGLEEANGQRLDDQIQQVKTFAQREEIPLEQIYYDTGMGKQPRSFRAGIFTLLDHIELHGTTDVIVVSTDRIIREGEIGRQILMELERARVAIHSLTEDPDKVKQDTKRITSTTVAALRSASTKIEALKRGKAPAGRAAYGYRRVPVEGEQGTELRVVEEEAKTVQWIFREYLRRRSMAKVAEGLHARGIPAPGGKAWSRASVAWILGNDIYIGLVKFGTVRGRGEHAAIIEPLLFHKVQQLRNSNRRNRKGQSEEATASASDTGFLTAEEIATMPGLEEAMADRTRLNELDRQALEAAERGETITAPHDHPGQPSSEQGEGGGAADDFEFEPLPQGRGTVTGGT